MNRIRKKYSFLDGFSLAVPAGDAYTHQLGFVILYEDALVAGPCLLLHLLARDLLIFLGIAPGSLPPIAGDS